FARKHTAIDGRVVQGQLLRSDLFYGFDILGKIAEAADHGKRNAQAQGLRVGAVADFGVFKGTPGNSGRAYGRMRVVERSGCCGYENREGHSPGRADRLDGAVAGDFIAAGIFVGILGELEKLLRRLGVDSGRGGKDEDGQKSHSVPQGSNPNTVSVYGTLWSVDSLERRWGEEWRIRHFMVDASISLYPPSPYARDPSTMLRAGSEHRAIGVA